MDDTCEFCQLVAGEQSAHVLYEDELTIAFLDRNPAVTGHTLVAPRVHEGEVLTNDHPGSAAVFETIRTVARALEAVLEPDGFSVFHTSGSLVGTVDHAHIHLVPRFADDDVTLSLSRTELDSDEAAALTAQVRALL
ncbi:HIT family protein [Haloterrigena sp. H1]|uniref:HIT family protein n=1 Tax=Haloterrigena sp. H1 TaxID=2552943 RepID=UPI00110E0F8F|nr:HIT family protein [Haloterrigena sp. H1]TMT87543.1 HIT family protein [Haloterrigena sp. H1]